MRRAKPVLLVLVTGLMTAALSACGGSADHEKPGGGDSQVRVVATTTQLADFVAEIGGSRVSVTGILQPNSDPHIFEPRPDDVIATAEADLIFLSGLDLDSWAEKLITESRSDAEVVDIGAGLPLAANEDSLEPDGAPEHDDDHHAGHDHGHGHEHDPHWWQDPNYVRAATTTISARLSTADPAGRDHYRRNAYRYDRRLETLDQQIKRCLARIPRQDRKLVTDHDSLSYFADHFGLELVGAVIPSLTSGAQPSARDLKQLAEKITANGVKAIFPEQALSPDLAKTLATQTGARLGGALYADALGPSGSAGDTYMKMMAANAETIMRGLSKDQQGCAIGEGN